MAYAKKRQWRSFTVPLARVALDPNAVTQVEALLNFLTIELRSMLADQDFLSIAMSHANDGRGEFRNAIIQGWDGCPHRTWSIPGQRAKYFRMLLAQSHSMFQSQARRNAVAVVCAAHNWDERQLTRIREALCEQSLYPTNYEIRNILRAKRAPSIPAKMKAQLDYSAEDKQVVRQDGLNYKIEVLGQWFSVHLQQPSHLRDGLTGRFSKPRLWCDENGAVMVTVAYEVDVAPLTGTGIMGVDLGKRKPFTAASVYPKGVYSTELSGSRELERLNSKLTCLSREMKYIRDKKNRIADLLSNTDESNLVQAWEALGEQHARLSNKRTRLKSHMQWVIARDIVNHALKSQVATIHMEDLRFVHTISGGRWDYSTVLQKVTEVASLNGISVETVDARNSSHENPFTGEYLTPHSRTRKSSLSDGQTMDRDYAAALVVASRKPRKRKHVAVSDTRPKVHTCRDKHSSTPKRPKAATRKHLMKKSTGVSITVALPGRDSATAHPTAPSGTCNTNSSLYVKVLRT